MHALVAVACAALIVALALRGVPRRVGVLLALVGVFAFSSVGYLWLLAMWIIVPRLDAVFAALPGVHLKGLFAMLLYFGPPTVAGLAAIGFLGSRSRRARMAG